MFKNKQAVLLQYIFGLDNVGIYLYRFKSCAHNSKIDHKKKELS